MNTLTEDQNILKVVKEYFNPAKVLNIKRFGSGHINDTYIVTAGITANEIHLAEDEYFCLGDNRNNSEDSRFSSIGMVKKKHVIGKVWMVLQPFEDIRFVK